MWDRISIKQEAKNLLNEGYWYKVLASLILCIALGRFSLNVVKEGKALGESIIYSGYWEEHLMSFSLAPLSLIGTVLAIFVFNQLIVGGYKFYLSSLQRKESLGQFAFAFEHEYLNVTLVMFLRGLFTFLWTLLFIIPGIVKSYEYRMIPYILAENPSLDKREVFALSREMMYGNKWRVFVFDLSFLGWMILSAFTFQILYVFYVGPYYQTTCAKLYAEISRDYKAGPEEKEQAGSYYYE